MAHYAFLDENNIVTEVIVGKDENELGIDWEQKYSSIKKQKCKRTSYNTHGNVHLLGGTPYRKNYAGIGYTYREDIDGFVPPSPFESWVLDINTCLWEAPIPIPQDGNAYTWNEGLKSWEISNTG